MKNQKQLLSLTVPDCPQVELTGAVVTTTASYYRKKSGPFVYRADTGDDGLLTVTAYNLDRSPMFRVFLRGRQYISQAFEDTGPRVSEARIGYLIWWDDRRHGDYFTTPEDAEKIRAWVRSKWSGTQKKEADPLWLLNAWQQKLLEIRLKERYDRIRKSIDDAMLEIRPLPKDINRWIDNVPLAGSRYIYYRYTGRKYVDGYCTSCKSDVTVEHPLHNKPGRCPHCGRKITYKTVSKSENIRDRANFAYIQPLSNGYAIRWFKVTKYYDHYRQPEYNIHEFCRQMETDEDRTSYWWEDFRNTGEYRFCGPYYQSGSSDKSYLYTTNLKRVFRDHPQLKYFPFGEFAKKAGPVNVCNLIPEVIRKPQLEYLVKLGFVRLAAEVVNNDRRHIELVGAKIRDALGVCKDDIPVLRALNPGNDDLKLFRAARRYGIQEAADLVKSQQGERVYNTGDLCDVLRYASPRKVLRYLDAQWETEKGLKTRWGSRRYSDKNDILRDWKDYLGECRLLRYDLKNDFVLFPKNLAEAHDQAMEMGEAEEKGGYPVIAEMADEFNRYYAYAGKELLIRAPKDHKELTREGQKLKHCVATYAKEVARGETVILFIRKVSEPDKPFYTLEYQDGEVQQCRGLQNCSMTENVKKFVETWKKIITRRQAKATA